MNISLAAGLLRLCLTVSSLLLSDIPIFHPLHLPPLPCNFSGLSARRPAYCSDPALKYSHSKSRLHRGQRQGI